MSGQDVERLAEECVFCQIVTGNAPAQFVLRDERVVAFHPLNPVTEGHLLVVPTKHVINFMHDPAVTAETAGVAARLAANWMDGGDTNLITSAGGYATQTVRHLHFHIVPRSRDDGLLLPWTGAVVTEALEACREQRTDLLELLAAARAEGRESLAREVRALADEEHEAPIDLIHERCPAGGVGPGRECTACSAAGRAYLIGVEHIQAALRALVPEDHDGQGEAG